MTPDLTAIVESAARELNGDAWDRTDDFTRALARESLLPIVRATLTALMPLADGWEAMAEKNDRLGMSRIERAEAAAADGDGDAEDDQLKYARVAFASRDAHKSCARQLRMVMEP